MPYVPPFQSSPGGSVPAPRSGSLFQPLEHLVRELQALGLETSVDASISVVDASLPEGLPADRTAMLAPSKVLSAAAGYGDTFQRVILRADGTTCRPWWWLLWPEERFRAETAEPEVTRLLPVERTPEAARRIRNILFLTDGTYEAG